jgi:hypothetical protein
VVALWALAQFPTDVQTVLPAALQGVTNSDVALKLASIFFLNRIHSDPDKAVRALTNCLSDPTVADPALQAICNYGTGATSAVPSVIGLLKSPTHQYLAGKTLKAIDPQAAAEAGLK